MVHCWPAFWPRNSKDPSSGDPAELYVEVVGDQYDGVVRVGVEVGVEVVDEVGVVLLEDGIVVVAVVVDAVAVVAVEEVVVGTPSSSPANSPESCQGSASGS